MLEGNITKALSDENFSVSSHEGIFFDEGGRYLSHLEITFLVLKSIIILTIISFSVINNVLVIISVVLYRRLRHINNYFLVSLAFADLFVALFAMTFKATVEITGRWNFSFFMCDFWNSMDVHASTVSTLHLCCISVDRYYAIARPLQYHMVITVRVACLMIALAWIVPTAISFLPIFLGWYTTAEFLEERFHHPDECLFVVNKTYAFLSSSLTFWLPVLVMITLYYRIYKEAKRHRAAIRRHSIPMACHNTLVIPSACAIGVVTPSSYSLNIMIGSSKLGDKPGQPNYVTGGGQMSNGGARRASTSSSSFPRQKSGTAVRRNSAVDGQKADNKESPNASPVRSSASSSRPSDGSVWSRDRVATSITNSSRASTSAKSSSSSSAAERRAVRSANWRKEHKAFVTLGLVMGAFLLCWLPFFLWYLVSTICGSSCPPSPDIIVAILFWIGYFNSTLNPIIYVMTNHEFKEAFTNIIRRALCCSSSHNGRVDAAYSFSQTTVSQGGSRTPRCGSSDL